MFAHVYLRNIEPEINGSHIEDSVLRFLFDDDRVTNIDIEFYVPGFPTPFETYQNYNDTPGENFQTIYHDLTYVTEIQVKYIITYIGYGETFVYTYSTVEKIY